MHKHVITQYNKKNLRQGKYFTYFDKICLITHNLNSNICNNGRVLRRFGIMMLQYILLIDIDTYIVEHA